MDIESKDKLQRAAGEIDQAMASLRRYIEKEEFGSWQPYNALLAAKELIGHVINDG
jgi:hypothetical protein